MLCSKMIEGMTNRGQEGVGGRESLGKTLW